MGVAASATEVAEGVEVEVAVVTKTVALLVADTVIVEDVVVDVVVTEGASVVVDEVVPNLSICKLWSWFDYRNGNTNANSAGQPVPPPDARITKLEDEAVQDARSSLNLGKLSLQADELPQFPARPAYGTQGKPLTVRTNYFELQQESSPMLYRYNISVLGTAEEKKLSKAKMRRYVELLLSNVSWKGKVVATDYSAILVTKEKLERNILDWRIVMYNKREPPMSENGKDEMQKAAIKRKTRNIEVKFVGEFMSSQLWSYINSKSADAELEAKNDIRQLLNIILHKPSNEQDNIVNVGQNEMFLYQDKYCAKPGQGQQLERADLGNGLHALRGYFSSVRLATGRVLVNIKEISRAFYNEGPCDELIRSFRPQRKGPAGIQETSKFLKGLAVMTEYSIAPNDPKGARLPRQKTIWGVAVKPKLGASSDEVMVDWDGTEYGSKKRLHSITEYFKFKYQIRLNQPKAMVLNCGNDKNPAYIPPELCYVIGGQQAKRALTPEQTTTMLDFAARAPEDNARSIENQGLALLSLTDAQQGPIKAMGIKMGQRMLTVPARELPPPSLTFAGNKRVKVNEGGWNLANSKFVRGGTPISLGLLQLRNDKCYTQDIGKVLKTVVDGLKVYGMNVQVGKGASVLDIGDLVPENYDSIAKLMDGMFGRAAKVGILWMLVVIPKKHAWLYSRVKFFGDVRYGINTVVIQDSNANNKILGAKTRDNGPDLMLIGNLGLKFVGKASGQAWQYADQNALKPIDASTMVVGIDVTHPAPDSANQAPSIAAVVASYDKGLSAYLGGLKLQKGKVEMVEGLTDLLCDRLIMFQRKNEMRLPTKIIVYRDGVSEGQFNDVLRLEFDAMRKAYQRMYKEESKFPKTSIIVCGKRHQTRFYPTNAQNMDQNSGNNMPGTVVDRHVTGVTGEGQKVWDFFIQPHKALKGTAKPCHCIVIKDEIGLGINVESMVSQAFLQASWQTFG